MVCVCRILFAVAVWGYSGWKGVASSAEAAGNRQAVPRCEAVPMGGGVVSLRIEGAELVRWNPGVEGEPRGAKAHFFPVRSPAGALLTRMGHPGAPNHDHHRSLWFAHHDVGGADFWSVGRGVSIRQKEWLAYRDGEGWAGMAVKLGWQGVDGRDVLVQEMAVSLSPAAGGGALLEIQSIFRPVGEGIALGKTNFGLVGLRMAKSISEHFGGGRLTDSEGRTGEEAVFGQRARWVDYSGPVSHGKGQGRVVGEGGITWFDHPENPRYPTRWHVREDGWMGASLCFEEPFQIGEGEDLVVRYLFHLRDGAYERESAAEMAGDFEKWGRLVVEKSTEKHTAHALRRLER